MTKTKLSLMVLDDNTENAITAIHNAIASIADAPLDVKYSSPWTVILGSDREIEITLDEEVAASLSSQASAKAFLLDRNQTSQYDIILVDINWSSDGGSRKRPWWPVS